MKRLTFFHRLLESYVTSFSVGLSKIILLTLFSILTLNVAGQSSGGVTTGKIIKWDQPPALAVSTNVYYGWNEPSLYNIRVAADDWVCTTTNPVMKIRWWGSFAGWTDTNAAPVLPFDFRIHFWTDSPKGPGNPFSHPLQAIWQIICTNFTWQCVGQDFDPRTGTFETCFLFEQTLTPQEWFYQNPLNGTNIYWLSIAADYPVGIPVNQFGWKTCPRNSSSPAPDAAVVIQNPNNPVVGSVFGTGFPIVWPTQTNEWDLAFELVTVASSPTAKWAQLPDLTPLGIDVDASGSMQNHAPYLLADDFLCTSPGFITNIVIWGSWLNDVLPLNPAGAPDATAVTFLISIHDDIPATNSPTGYSMPGPIRRLFTVGPTKFIHTVRASNIQEGWLYPPGVYLFPGDTVCHQYEIQLGPNDDPFFQDGTAANPKVFWLDVQAMPFPGPGGSNAVFGWKTSVTNWNDAGVWANAVEPFGGPWNKLVYPPGHPKTGNPIDFAFRISSGATLTDTIKWSQPPVVATNPGNWYNGWNEPSIDGGGFFANTFYTNIVADDWLCTNARPVTDIHWWGSFLGWSQTNLPTQPPVAFHFGIWTDVPQATNQPFSHPGILLWEYTASLTDPNLKGNWVGWDLDPRNPGISAESCFKFDYFLPKPSWFFQPNGTNIFWLSIAARYPGGPGSSVGPNPFGWKTRPHRSVPPDDAVRIFEPLFPSPTGIPFGSGQPIEYPAGTSWDTAFRLTTCQQFPLTNVVFTNIVVTNIVGPQQVITIKWNSEPGVIYQLQEVSALGPYPMPWSDVGPLIVGPANSISVTNPPAFLSRFYRLSLPDICP